MVIGWYLLIDISPWQLVMTRGDKRFTLLHHEAKDRNLIENSSCRSCNNDDKTTEG